MTDRIIGVDPLTRVEGEGALSIVIRDGALAAAHLEIIEPPRLFEAMLRGRHCTEAPDIAARVCGICPIAYQISAVHAVEAALGVSVPPQIQALRRLIYCGEWIESHALHIALLHAPDFLGYPGAIEMARDHPDLVRDALALKQVGNALMTLIGGREIHPINLRVGGFYRAPRRAELAALGDDLKRARDTALALVQWTAGLDFPERERDYTLVALRADDGYPIEAGRIVSNRGLDIPVAGYDAVIRETQVAHSTALHAELIGEGAYLTGPLARYSLNFDRLSPLAQDAARAAGLDSTCHNPFRSIQVRAVETLYACDEALRLIADYQSPDPPAIRLPTDPPPSDPIRTGASPSGRLPAGGPVGGIGHGASEAPRGLLYHRYRIDADGLIQEARLIPPTSQNQASIEADLAAFIPDWLALPDDALRQRCEQTVRNHDPCISCATHFLRFAIDRGPAPETAARQRLPAR